MINTEISRTIKYHISCLSDRNLIILIDEIKIYSSNRKCNINTLPTLKNVISVDCNYTTITPTDIFDESVLLSYTYDEITKRFCKTVLKDYECEDYSNLSVGDRLYYVNRINCTIESCTIVSKTMYNDMLESVQIYFNSGSITETYRIESHYLGKCYFRDYINARNSLYDKIETGD